MPLHLKPCPFCGGEAHTGEVDSPPDVEDVVADFVCSRLKVVDPSADPIEEGHLG